MHWAGFWEEFVRKASQKWSSSFFRVRSIARCRITNKKSPCQNGLPEFAVLLDTVSAGWSAEQKTHPQTSSKWLAGPHAHHVQNAFCFCLQKPELHWNSFADTMYRYSSLLPGFSQLDNCQGNEDDCLTAKDLRPTAFALPHLTNTRNKGTRVSGL